VLLSLNFLNETDHLSFIALAWDKRKNDFTRKGLFSRAQMLPHGSSPNHSETPRAVQLLTLRPAGAIDSQVARIARARCACAAHS